MKEKRVTLIHYRLEQADESLESAEILFHAGKLRPSVSRSYYAMFYAVLALLSLKGDRTSKHAGVIALFDREFVKKGIFDKDLSRWLHEAFDLRQRSDYREMFTISPQRAYNLIEHAKAFILKVKDLIKVR